MTTAVVVTYNSMRWVRDCLASLTGFPTVVVDNASTDDTVAVVHAEFPAVRVIARARNGGYAVAVNEGCRAAGDDEVMILNPDVVASRAAIGTLEAYLDTHLNVGIVAPRLVYPDGSIQPSVRQFPSPLKMLARRSPFGRTRLGRRFVASYLMTEDVRSEPRSVDVVIGAAMLVRRTAILEVGGMDERMFLYGEDFDWCYRMWAAGWEVHQVPAAIMQHHYERSSRRTLAFRSAAVRHHWASIIKLYAIHPRLLIGWGPRNRGGAHSRTADRSR